MVKSPREYGAVASALATSPLVRDSAPDLIARSLREAIATGRLQPGQQLLEASLAAGFGVSRGPLREAMQRLTQEGLLVSRRNRGIFVMELDEAAVRDMYLARRAIERAAVEHLIETGRHGQAVRLLGYVERMRSWQETPTSPEIAELDMAFHEALVALSSSSRLIRMHSSLVTQVRLCLSRMQHTYDTVLGRAAEHEGIARAVMAGDAVLADNLLIAHMEDGQARLLSFPEDAPSGAERVGG